MYVVQYSNYVSSVKVMSIEDEIPQMIGLDHNQTTTNKSYNNKISIN